MRILACVMGWGCLVPAGMAFAQPDTNLMGATCAAVALETLNVRSASVEHPFAFVGPILNSLVQARVSVGGLKDKPYSSDEVREAKERLLNQPFLSEADGVLVRFSYVAVYVDKCESGGLDLIFQVFSARVSTTLGGLFESISTERLQPQKAAGVTDPKQPVRFLPQFSYNASDHLSAGGKMEFSAEASRLPIDDLTLEGRTSNSSQLFSADLSRVQATGKAALARVDYRLGYLYSVAATDRDPLRTSRLMGQVWAATKPVGKRGVVLRYGSSLEGGNMRSQFGTNELAPDSVAATGYGSLKLFGGLTMRSRRQSLAASFGAEFGSTPSEPTVDYTKQVADVSHLLSIRAGDHQFVELESRLGWGRISGSGTVPVPKLFFGGNTEQNFVSSSLWMIRENPFIRSLPSNTFYATQDGAGGNRFFAYNLTAAFPGAPKWHRPLVPLELTQDKQFPTILNGALISAKSTLALDYAAKDKSFVRIGDSFKGLGETLKELESAVKQAQAAAGSGVMEAEFRDCLRRSSTVQRRLKGATAAEPEIRSCQRAGP